MAPFSLGAGLEVRSIKDLPIIDLGRNEEILPAVEWRGQSIIEDMNLTCTPRECGPLASTLWPESNIKVTGPC
jgi:hypothetical protein